MLKRLGFLAILAVIAVPAMLPADWAHAIRGVPVAAQHRTAPVVRVHGIIVRVFPAPRHHHDASHQHFTVRIDRVLTAEGMDASAIGPLVFVALRFGDREGLDHEISGLRPGMPIEMQGEYVASAQAYKAQDNEGDPPLPVLHFTHHPLGFILYGGQRYD